MADHRNQAGELAEALSRGAEAVCRHYLSAGRRSGHHWIVGDVDNTPGRSLYVRLTGPISGKGAAGRWCDAATGQHGDLLDLVRLNRGYGNLRDAMDEARSFLALPRPAPKPYHLADRRPGSSDTVAMARRLFASGQPLRGTLAERYLLARDIDLAGLDAGALRFHPAAHYRDAPDTPRAELAGAARRRHRPRRHSHRRASHLPRSRTQSVARPRTSRQGARRLAAPLARPARWQWRPPSIP